MNKLFSLQIPENLYNTLDKISKNKQRSKGFIVRELIEEYIQDYVDLKYAEQVSREIEEGKAELISWEEIKEKYGLEN